MFERFTERARQVVVLAQEEARTLKHNYIGTEHILLGLLREEEGLAARVLESLDITVERVRARAGCARGRGVAAPASWRATPSPPGGCARKSCASSAPVRKSPPVRSRSPRAR